MEFLREHFTVLILVSLIILSTFVTIHLMHHSQDVKYVEWGEGIASGFISALLLALKVNNKGGTQ